MIDDTEQLSTKKLAATDLVIYLFRRSHNATGLRYLQDLSETATEDLRQHPSVALAILPLSGTATDTAGGDAAAAEGPVAERAMLDRLGVAPASAHAIDLNELAAVSQRIEAALATS